MSRENKPPIPLTDESICPSGKHKGEKMGNVPADYLLYVYNNDMCSQAVAQYVVENMEVLKQQVKK